MEIREKRNFFSLWPPGRKGREISGWVQWVKWCPHIGQQMHCWQTVAAGPFWPCFACPKLGDAGKTRVASKNRAVSPKTFRPQFSRLSLALFLLASRVLLASPNFGQAKHGQNDPSATVCQQCICCPIRKDHFTCWTHPYFSLRFRAGGRRVKNFRFSRISISLW